MLMILVAQFVICGYVVWHTRRQIQSNRVDDMMGLTAQDYEPVSFLPWRI